MISCDEFMSAFGDYLEEEFRTHFGQRDISHFIQRN